VTSSSLPLQASECQVSGPRLAVMGPWLRESRPQAPLALLPSQSPEVGPARGAGTRRDAGTRQAAAGPSTYPSTRTQVACLETCRPNLTGLGKTPIAYCRTAACLQVTKGKVMHSSHSLILPRNKSRIASYQCTHPSTIGSHAVFGLARS
jgi:hypothetical protein